MVQIDPDGNESAPIIVEVDLTPPDAPTVQPTDGESVSGTAEPGSTVKVKDADGNVLCETVAAPDGRWSCTLEPPAKKGDLLSVTATDANGNESEATLVRVGGPWLELSAERLLAGDVLDIMGHGFLPNEQVAGTVYSDPVGLGTLTADADGDVTFTFTVPEGFETGEHRAVLDGVASGEVSEAFTVIAPATPVPPTPTAPPQPGLPITGGQSLLLLGAAGVLLLGAGAGIAARSRRSRAGSRD
ncbi:Ig-like domain-containing protein [Leucobacter luti]|uniref:Ig-like domain-containing protein n=1 Tax=Leucobacter luti TaxID=340320 RepID=UPI003075D9FB